MRLLYLKIRILELSVSNKNWATCLRSTCAQKIHVAFHTKCAIVAHF